MNPGHTAIDPTPLLLNYAVDGKKKLTLKSLHLTAFPVIAISGATGLEPVEDDEERL